MIDPRLKIPNLEADFESVVDSIRKTGTITNTIVSGNSTVLTLDNSDLYLKKDQVLLINGVDCRIDEASETEVKVNKNVDGATEWKALFPYFMDGHIKEISKRLTEKDKSGTNLMHTKYPLVILFQDFDYDNSKLNSSKVSIDFAIVNGTNSEYITSERREHNFTPILDPIYNELMGAISTASVFSMENNDFIVSRKYYWGSSLTDSNPTNDPLDAISVNGLNLRLITTKC